MTTQADAVALPRPGFTVRGTPPAAAAADMTVQRQRKWLYRIGRAGAHPPDGYRFGNWKLSPTNTCSEGSP